MMPINFTSSADSTRMDLVRVLRSKVIRRTQVKNATFHGEADAFPSAPLRLGPIENLIAAFIPIAIVYVYEAPKPHADLRTARGSESFISGSALQRAMALLLDYYPPLSGRLVQLPDGERVVDHLDSGALFVEAVCSKTLAELHSANSAGIDASDGVCDEASEADAVAIPTSARRTLSLFDLPAGSNALFAPFDPSPAGICGNFLFSIQHTRFACGGVSLGVRISHALCDAQGFFLVMQHLTELFRKLRSAVVGGGDEEVAALFARLDHPPIWRPYLAHFRDEAAPAELEAALSYTPLIYRLQPPAERPVAAEETLGSSEGALQSIASLASPVVGRTLHFSPSQLRDLKCRATPADGSRWVSTFEAINAFLWQSVYRARCTVGGFDDTDTGMPVTSYLTSANVRERFLPRAADALWYFPVGCLTPNTSLDPITLRDGPLSTVAAALHDLLHASDFNAAEVQRTVHWLAAQPDKTRIGTSFTSGGLMMSAWNKFDVYFTAECDGTRPVLVAPPFTSISLLDGLGYILPSSPTFTGATTTERCAAPKADAGADGILVYLALASSLWDVLQQKDFLGQYLY